MKPSNLFHHAHQQQRRVRHDHPALQQQFLRREIERWGQLIRKYGVAGD